jgi:hypothetical protein
MMMEKMESGERQRFGQDQFVSGSLMGWIEATTDLIKRCELDAQM